MKKLFGKNLKNIRKSRDITQAILAEKVNVEPKHISCIENGLNFPSADLISRLAESLDVQPYELFLFSEKPSILKIKEDLISLINTARDEEVERIYLYSKFVTAEHCS